jgi:nicotinate-nucleotide pyrophosphorylase (carboxylating)
MDVFLSRPLVEQALREDLGRAGDLTSEATISKALIADGVLIARAGGVIAGLEVALEAFRLVDPTVEAERFVDEGDEVSAGTRLARVRGRARALLTAERTALNFLGHLSGIASTTRGVVRAVEGTGVRVTCTRKTTPGLRGLEKEAVRLGGGVNHRFGLDDGILIKDNHRVLAGGVRAAVLGARARAGHMIRIELEVDTLEELDEGLALGIDAFLLDNMSLDDLREAVRRVGGRAVLEASGGITPARVREVADTGVHLMSMGWLTHSAPSLDVSLDVIPVVHEAMVTST